MTLGLKRKVIGWVLVSLAAFGNVANVQNSSGANVTQKITNRLPKPFILENNLLSINVPDGGIYRTTFSFRIKNYYKNQRKGIRTSREILAKVRRRMRIKDYPKWNQLCLADSVPVT